MKNLFFSCLCLLSLLSCSKDDNEKSDNQLLEKTDELKISTVINMQSEVSQKTAYLLLNDKEKMSLWQDKLNSVVKENNFSADQKAIIEELIKKITPEVFSKKDNNYKAYFKNIYLVNTIKKLQYSLSDKEIIKMIFELNKPKNIMSKTTAFVTAEGNNCNCNQGSVITCAGGSNSCKSSSKCENDGSMGCGAFWLFECNGKCNSL